MTALYQWNARDYEKHSAGQFKWALELIARLRLNGTESVIDLGCGDGKVTAELADRLPRGHVLGIDSAPPMVELASQKFPSHRHPNLHFACLDFRDLEFKEEFDLAFSSAALHWVKDQRRVLMRVAQALRPGAQLLFQMGGAGNARQVIEVMDEMIARSAWKRWFTDFDFPYGFYHPHDYERWAVEAGLRLLHNELIAKDMVHEGISGLAGWIRTTWMPYLDRLPPTDRDVFVRTLCEEFLRRHPSDDAGRVHVSMVRLEVAAVRPN